MPRFWVSIHSYKKQPVKNYLGRILDIVWHELVVVALKASLILKYGCIIFINIQEVCENLNFPTNLSSIITVTIPKIISAKNARA